MIRRDFNEIKNNEDKREGRKRQKNSFSDFRNLILDIKIGDIGFRGETFTWANNREGAWFIWERLDKFFGSTEWMLQFDIAEVTYILRQTSDHSLLILDTKP